MILLFGAILEGMTSSRILIGQYVGTVLVAMLCLVIGVAPLARGPNDSGEAAMKPRHQLYLDDALSERLEALAARPGKSKSAIVSEALWAFLTQGAKADLDAFTKVRLDRIAENQARLERAQQLTLETLAQFIRFQFMFVPRLPEADLTAARALSQERFQRLIEQVGRRISGGSDIVGQMTERIGSVSPDADREQRQ